MVARAFGETSGITWLRTSPCVTEPARPLLLASTRGGLATFVSAAGAADFSARLSLVFSIEESEGIGATCCEGFIAELSAGADFCTDFDAFLPRAAAGMGFAAGCCGDSK